ncbi:MAG: excinuclease ABC subunit UvrA [Deltaproteobacteria bacterium]|nr:excinuclease ABC subunit UvrA [Deltaproteobacteria bacterium]
MSTSSPSGTIVVRGARTHNLKRVDVDLPRNQLVVITGPSGSGKSSLAFDTIYAEGRRRYVESLSVYARQLLGSLGRPEVDLIEGLSPAIAIAQRMLGRNPRSTVGTITELDDYLRLLMARAGTPHCPSCKKPVRAHTAAQMVEALMAKGEGARLTLAAPAVRGVRGSFESLWSAWRGDGFVRVRVDGQLMELGDCEPLDPGVAHQIDLVIDRVVIKEGVRARLREAVELAIKHGGGLLRVIRSDLPDELFSERFSCADCSVTLPDIEPALFSFNSPKGACSACHGLGVRDRVDLSRWVGDPTRSLRGGVLLPFKRGLPSEVEQWARTMGVDLEAPFETLSERARDELFEGDGDLFEGVVILAERAARGRTKKSESARDDDESAADDDDTFGGRFRRETHCDVCHGSRLRSEALAVTLGGENIATLSRCSVRELHAQVESLVSSLDAAMTKQLDRLLDELRGRLGFLQSVGLGYLSLSRASSTLSSGEAQRVRLATQLGSALMGVLYVLDEPSVGLHPADTERLLVTLRTLVDRGNSVLLVEHDLSLIAAADYVVDMGPGAGIEGGSVLAAGSVAEVMRSAQSVTAPYLRGERRLKTPAVRRRGGALIAIEGARLHNLQSVNASLRTGTLVSVTGVSGSGKSSLILGTLVPSVRAFLRKQVRDDLCVTAVRGLENFDRLVAVDASPLGRSSRSSPATYTGIFAHLRELFASVPEARARGFKAGRFSFNVKGGRCEVCLGEGERRVEMHFLPDVFVRCEACEGSRYDRETLSVRYRGFSIADVLSMRVDDALPQFEAIPRVRELLQALHSVGLGYLALGQRASTLSGGEAQRVKLARELARKSTGRTLYVLDEPTTGLHSKDVELLIELLERLVDQGNTVVVIEHNMDVVRCSDWVIDVGPRGGDGGGKVVAMGTPEDIAIALQSATANALAAALGEGAAKVPEAERSVPKTRARAKVKRA